MKISQIEKTITKHDLNNKNITELVDYIINTAKLTLKEAYKIVMSYDNKFMVSSQRYVLGTPQRELLNNLENVIWNQIESKKRKEKYHTLRSCYNMAVASTQMFETTEYVNLGV